MLGRIRTGGAFFGESVNADYGFGGGVGTCPFGEEDVVFVVEGGEVADVGA